MNVIDVIIGFLLGCIVSILFFMHFEDFSQQFPEPDGKVIIDNEEWRWYGTNKTKVGPSPKVWVHRHGVIYEPSGVKFPEWNKGEQSD